MCARRSKTIHLPSGEMSTDIQVPSEVSKSISRVLPRARVVSHFAAGLSFSLSLSFSSAREEGGLTSNAAKKVKRKIARRAGRSELMLVLHGCVVGRPQRTGQTRSTLAEGRRTQRNFHVSGVCVFHNSDCPMIRPVFERVHKADSRELDVPPPFTSCNGPCS